LRCSTHGNGIFDAFSAHSTELTIDLSTYGQVDGATLGIHPTNLRKDGWGVAKWEWEG